MITSKQERVIIMSKKRQEMKFILQLLIVVTGGFIVATTCSMACWFYNALEKRSSEREANCATLDAQPIPDAVVTRLCDSNLIPDSLDACDGNTLLRQEVGTIMRSNITPNTSSYDDVSEMFGSYQIHCATPQEDWPNFRCTYDISGIGPRINVFYDSQTRLVESIKVTSCGGS